MSLSPIRMDLPPLDDSHFSRLRRGQKALKKRAQSVGQRSSRLDRAVDEMKGHLGGFGRKDLANKITTAIEAKAFAKIFAHDDAAARLIISDNTLSAIKTTSPRIKRQTLMLLIEGYLRHYDEMLDADTLDRMGGFIRESLALFGEDGRQSDLSSLAKRRDKIFCLEGPSFLTNWSQQQSVDLVDTFEDFGLSAYCEGRYFLVCRHLYYLEELKSIPVGENHRILNEITKKSVYMSPGKDMPHLGHEMLCIIIDRSIGSAISDSWMKVILEIAGDPRVPESSQGHRLWWSRLGDKRISLMRGWLSRLDLKLFLNVLEDYGKTSGDTGLQRMFPSRKRFLEGLIDSELVTSSRLFVNPRAENFLKQGYAEEDLPEYARVRDTYRSMIYLHVGNLHMIEGSHSFKLWIFPQLPEAAKILDYQQTSFVPADLSSNLKSRYFKEFGEYAERPADIVHQPQRLAWQHQAITCLKEGGIKLDIEKLFSPEDYRLYLRLYEL